MAQTLNSVNDDQGFQIGEQGQALPTATTQRLGVVVGGADDSNVFQRLPIGTSASGTAVRVDLIGTEHVVVEIGTVTIGTLTSLGTLVGAGTLTALGSITQGSISSVGTVVGLGSVSGVGTIPGVGSVAGIGTVSMLNAGTITKVEGGTINVNFGTGIVPRGNSVGALNVGWWNVNAAIADNDPNTIDQWYNVDSNAALKVQTRPSIYEGTVWNRERAANSSNGGTGIGLLGAGILGIDTGGTYHRVITDTGGTIVLPNTPGGTLGLITRVGNLGTLESGTITSLGTVTGVGSVGGIGTVSGIGGTVMVDIAGTEPIVVQIGTISAATINTGTVNAGTIDLLKLGTITRVEGGSIAVTAGTFTGAGGSIISYGAGLVGTVAVGNPLVTAGTDGGGTVYAIKVDTAGNPQVDILSGSIAVIAGTEIITSGSIAVTAGTITAGTLTNLVSGTINSATVSGNLGTLSMINAGTISDILFMGGGTVINVANEGLEMTMRKNQYTAADGVSNLLNIWRMSDSSNHLPAVFSHRYNGTTWDRERNNNGVTNGTILASAERTASTTSADQVNYDWRGARLYLNVSTMSGTPTLDVAVQTKDPVSGTYFNLSGGTLPQIGTTGTDELTIYPGIAETGGETVSDVLPRTWRINTTQGAGGSITYSIGASYIV